MIVFVASFECYLNVIVIRDLENVPIADFNAWRDVEGNIHDMEMIPVTDFLLLYPDVSLAAEALIRFHIGHSQPSLLN